MAVQARWLACREESSGQTLRCLLTTEFLGGFVAFSTFSPDAALLWGRGDAGMALVYVLGAVAMSLVGVFTGPFLMWGLLN